jgi:plastocyanin
MNRIPVLLILSPALCAGSLEGTVRILDKGGRARPTLKDCVAMLEPVEAPRSQPGPQKPIAIRTLGKQFSPRVSLATPGTEVRFPNQDPILHNAFSITPSNRFDTGLYAAGESPRITARAPGLVKIYCNVHHQMNAFLWVVETPFAQLLEGRPGLSFDNVPPGTWRLRLWHPETGDRTWTVVIGPGRTRGDWTLEVSQPSVEPHRNKFGKDYPPPSDDGTY